MDSLYIVMPAYNEEENIRKVVEEWYSVIEVCNSEGNKNSRLLVVNDGSKDATSRIGHELSEKYPYLEFVDKENSGHGATVLYAYRHAIQAKADYIFQTDSDGQTVSGEFWDFWKKKKEYDAIIGYRKHRKDGVSRIIVTKVLKLVLLIVFGLKIPDANTPFRLMKRELLEKYIEEIPEDFNLSNIMLTVLFLYNEEKVSFVPITFRQRQGGLNSINMRKACKIGMKAISDFRAIKKDMKKRNAIKRGKEDVEKKSK